MGFSAKGVKGNQEAFFSDFPLPAVAHVIVEGQLLHYLLIYLSQKLDIDLLLGYYNHVIKLPMNFFGTRKTGEIASRFQDSSKVRDAISGATLTLMVDTLMVLVFLDIIPKVHETG